MSNGPLIKKGWEWAIDDLKISTFEFQQLQKKKFGKTVYDLEQSGINIYSENIRKGLLEILESCNYECLVDHSQKPRKSVNNLKPKKKY